MNKLTITSLATAAVAAGALFHVVPAAAGMFDMMNPGSWFGDDDDDYYRYGRWGGPWGHGGPYGYGGGPYGGYYGGGPWGGYGPYGGYGGPYGYGGYGYRPGGNTIVVTPQSGGDKDAPRAPE